MHDSASAPNHPAPAQPPGASARPLYPLWIFNVMNPVMKGILRSPLHGLMSGSLMLLTYRGHKTGKHYTIPIGYFRWAPDEVMAFSSARWRTNLRGHAPVTLLLNGQQLQAVPSVIEERDAVIDTLEEFLRRLGPAAARRLPIGLPRDRTPTRQDLLSAPPGIALVHFRIVPHP
ncbi:MAG: hypothetical protein ACLQUY_02420 [Ktedonobacterales bacterium]